MRQFLFLLGSSRRNGNSEALARHAAAALAPDDQQRWLRLLDLDLPDFLDIRHDASGVYPAPEGDGQTLLEATLGASDLVMVAPLYWYSMPTRTKNYLDHWSGWMRVRDLRFLERMAGKTLWVISAVSDEDFTVADPLIQSFRLTANYCRMQWGGSLLGFGNRPGEILSDEDALRGAATLFA